MMPSAIGLNHKWDLTGKGVNVAVLDTGIARHPDFDDRIILFRDFVRGKQRLYDDNGHGTHVAGIIGGSGAVSDGRFRGVAPGCGIVALKVLDRKGNGSMRCVLAGLRWVLNYHRQYRIRIVNISVGAIPKEYGDESTLIRSVEQLWEEGLIVTVAAGNRGPKKNSVTTPGISRKVITVGCYDDVKAVEVAGSVMSDYSGRGPVAKTCVIKPEVVASGFNVVSCNVITPRHPKPYTMKSGTSMATPAVSGAMALLLEKYPDMTNVQAKLRLYESCDDLGLPKSHQGWGRLNIDRLLALPYSASSVHSS